MKNSKSTLVILFFLYATVSMAQVGIGNTTPGATLDITATNSAGTTVDGLLIPRVTRLRAQTMSGTPTSTLIYVNDVSVGTATGTTINVTTVGFYYFDGTVWQKLAAGISTDWAVSGNSGLSGTTNFLGTTDAVDLAFRRNNAAAGKIGATSTSFGVNALSAGAATNNAAFGTNALALSTGTDNVAFGNGALPLVVGGIQNTAVGNAALATNTGSANTAVGNQALNLNASTSNNTAVGFQALLKNTASSNTAVGFQSLSNNIGATQNTALGFQALTTTNGSRNTSVGYAALQMNASGNENTAVGNFALGRNLGTGNTAMGHEAEFGSGTAFNNTTAVGYHALFGNSASNNTAVGYNALQANASATGNTAVGSGALNNSTGAGNTALGDSAGFERAAGTNNTLVGFEAGRYNSGSATNSYNSFFGSQAGHFSTGSFNTAIGANTLKANAATANNVAIGYNALNVTSGTGNVAIGYSAGSAEVGSNKLYIENSSADQTAALIYGDFSTDVLRINGTVGIGGPATAGNRLDVTGNTKTTNFQMTNGATNGYILQSSATGVGSWVSPSALSVTETDPQVSSTATSAVPRWNGATLVDGVIVDDATNVGVGITPSAGNKLEINGKTKTTNFQMTNSAANGYILQSDAAGNGTWVANTAANLSMVRANISGAQALTFPPGASWQKINFNTESFDSNNEFDTTTGRFTATKAGFYRITASYHTNNQSNTNLYSIAVMVNGGYYQMTSHDHSGSGNVERSVSCLVQLAVGGYVEIYAENFVSGVTIDSYSAKTTFEIEQIR
ncbi:MAG: hypothetical protein EOO51_14315 [Flavobacterium sp.]|nr:MAG: hypothetical protein EOO51_14315 [Flavobacterium sp.]